GARACATPRTGAGRATRAWSWGRRPPPFTCGWREPTTRRRERRTGGCVCRVGGGCAPRTGGHGRRCRAVRRMHGMLPFVVLRAHRSRGAVDTRTHPAGAPVPSARVAGRIHGARVRRTRARPEPRRRRVLDLGGPPADVP